MGTKAERSEQLIIKVIRDRGLHVGQPIPPELELAEMAGVSRGSIRTALGRLHERGIIQPKRGSGTILLQIPALIPDGENDARERVKSAETGLRLEQVQNTQEIVFDDLDSLLTTARNKLGASINQCAWWAAWAVRSPRKEKPVGLRISFFIMDGLEVGSGGQDDLYLSAMEREGALSAELRGEVLAVTPEQALHWVGPAADYLPKDARVLLMADEVFIAAAGRQPGRTLVFSRTFLGPTQSLSMGRTFRI